MTKKCPQDGGFIGDAGCTHPNHQHSELVKGLLANSSSPKMISAKDADMALAEGFYAKNQEGKRVAFGKKLLDHLNAHGKKDASARKARLAFAVSAVEHADAVEKNHRDLPGRTCYCKRFRAFGMFVISEPNSDTIEEVFTIVPKKGEKA